MSRWRLEEADRNWGASLRVTAQATEALGVAQKYDDEAGLPFHLSSPQQQSQDRNDES